MDYFKKRPKCGRYMTYTGGKKYMKARIVKEGNFWRGEVYGTWSMFGICEREGWGTVTSKCFTKLGAKLELMKWKREHIPDEFEI